ncbi:MAG: helix-turn-helix domain-containing protein [Deltaproteobacteria bacterium]|nr:helix-turn-helix domain-containing protein [Deltaproteobacteria bacterium]
MGAAEILSKNISYLLDNSQINQEDLADILGVQPSYISLIKTGRRWPRPALLEKIAKAFHVPLHCLFEEELPNKVIKTKTVSDKKRLVLIYDLLSSRKAQDWDKAYSVLEALFKKQS